MQIDNFVCSNYRKYDTFVFSELFSMIILFLMT